jgi:hypothetical protein
LINEFVYSKRQGLLLLILTFFHFMSGGKGIESDIGKPQMAHLAPLKLSWLCNYVLEIS